MDDLEEEILIEKEHILTTLESLDEALKRKEKSTIELAAIATFLQNTYNGIENIIKRTLKSKKENYLGLTMYTHDLPVVSRSRAQVPFCVYIPDHLMDVGGYEL